MPKTASQLDVWGAAVINTRSALVILPSTRQPKKRKKALPNQRVKALRLARKCFGTGLSSKVGCFLALLAILSSAYLLVFPG